MTLHKLKKNLNIPYFIYVSYLHFKFMRKIKNDAFSVL